MNYANGSPLVLGTVGASAARTMLGLGNVTNDAQAKAAVVPNTAPAEAQILIGGVSGAYAPKTLSGGATVDKDGVVALRAATPSVSGGMSATLYTKLTSMSSLRGGTIPAFVANAATITPGNDKASEYPIASSFTLPGNATLTVAVTNALSGAAFLITCRALALGYTISVVNDGPLKNTLCVIPASMTAPRASLISFDGTNFNFEKWIYVEVES